MKRAIEAPHDLRLGGVLADLDRCGDRGLVGAHRAWPPAWGMLVELDRAAIAVSSGLTERGLRLGAMLVEGGPHRALSCCSVILLFSQKATALFFVSMGRRRQYTFAFGRSGMLHAMMNPRWAVCGSRLQIHDDS